MLPINLFNRLGLILAFTNLVFLSSCVAQQRFEDGDSFSGRSSAIDGYSIEFVRFPDMSFSLFGIDAPGHDQLC